MENASSQTTDHRTIQEWADKYRGNPAILQDLPSDQKEILISFFGLHHMETMKPVAWEEWFNLFEDQKLVLLYNDFINAGEQAPYYKLVPRGEITDRHLQSPGEANLDKHINFLKEEGKGF